METANTGDRILPETRWVAMLVIPFLAVAFVILYLFPQDTERLFARKLQPSMSAMMLAAAYAGGIYFFTGVLMSKQWHRIKAGILPVTTFASLLGIATLLHWDRFNHDHIAFFAWAGLYLTTPFIVLAVWLRNRSQDPRRPSTTEFLVPRVARIVIGATGVITIVFSLLLFLQPTLMIAWWPWTLTPLTARVMGAMFALPGVVGLGVALDARWSAAQIILQSQGFSIFLILVAAARAWTDFDWTKPASWLFVGGLTAMLAAIIAFYWMVEARRVRQRPAPRVAAANEVPPLSQPTERE
jgi:hypothetical protein